MQSLKWSAAAMLALALATACTTTTQGTSTSVGAPRLGTPIAESTLTAWNIDVRGPDGAGLPVGSGTSIAGKAVYDAKCAACHGVAAAGGAMFGTMVGGIGSFKTDRRVLTPGSMYPYAPSLFDYIRRAMPMTEPQSLTNDEVYAVTAYILHLNGIIGASTSMNAASLRAVQMPNRDGFIVDDRPDTSATRCMNECNKLRIHKGG